MNRQSMQPISDIIPHMACITRLADYRNVTSVEGVIMECIVRVHEKSV